jgi:hypothetical protein
MGIHAEQLNKDSSLSGTNNLGLALDSTVTFSGATWTFPAGELLLSGTPSGSTDVATKGYVDGVASGLDLKASVEVATASTELVSNASISGTPVYSATGGTSTRGQITAVLAVSDTFTVDGVTLAAADDGARVLIKDEYQGTAQVSSVDTVADSSGSLNDTFFVFYTLPNQAFYVWYNINSAGTDPTPTPPAGVTYTGIEVAAATDATAVAIATLTKAAIEGADYTGVGGTPTVDRSTNELTITNLLGALVTNVADGSAATGFTFGTDTPGTGLGAAAHGIYTTTISGTSLTLDRADDFDSDSEVTAGAFTFIEGGTVNDNTGWVVFSNDPITCGGAGGTTIIFTQFSGAGQLTAGAGLTKSGDTININSGTGTSGGITVNANSIELALVTNGGLSITSNQAHFDPNDLTAATIDVANDGIAIIDANDSGNPKKEAWADVVTASAGNGLAASSGAYALDLNELSAAVIDVANDGIAIVDATDNSSKQEAWADIASAASGTGLTASAGVIAIDTASTVSFSGATWAFGAAGELTITGSSFSGTQVPNADWVTTQLATGVSWSYPVLSNDQLDSTNDCLSQAIAFYLDGTATAGDTFVISDGTPETWTGVAGVAGANQFSVDTGADEAMDSLATRITADSSKWSAVVVTALNAINDGSGTSTAGKVLVIYRKDQSSSSFTDRIYSSGANTSQALWQYVSLNGEDDYTKVTSANLPSADTTQKDFGPGKATADLSPGEAHVTLNGNSQYVWDADGATWSQISGTGSITAGAGLTKDGNTININSGTGTANGITVNADSIEAALATSGGLKFVSNEISIEPNDFAGTGLEDDGSDNLRLAAQGNGISGGAGSTLSVTAYDGIGVDANGVTAVTATATSGQQYGGLVNSRTANGSGAASAGAGYLAVATDDSTLRVNASNQLIIKALGVDTAQLAANAATIAKLGIQFNEETLPAAGFTSADPSVDALASTALVDSNGYGYVQCYRNGVADMTKNATGTSMAGTGATQFKLSADGTNIEIGADISATGNSYRVRYLSAL